MTRGKSADIHIIFLLQLLALMRSDIHLNVYKSNSSRLFVFDKKRHSIYRIGKVWKNANTNRYDLLQKVLYFVFVAVFGRTYLHFSFKNPVEMTLVVEPHLEGNFADVQFCFKKKAFGFINS